MLTPSFELQQNSEFLILVIKAPYVKANDVEIYIEEFDFKFYVKPYFLRLTFPCKVIESGKEQATYDIHKGVFTIHIPKLNYGEFFPNLDMLTLLLATNKKPSNKPLVEVLETENVCNNQLDAELTDDEFTWEIEQTLNQDFASDEHYEHKYGFGNKYSGLFASFKGELYEVIDLDSPEQTAPSDRQKQRKSAEIKKFDKDHYIADLMDNELIKPLLEFRPPWLNDYEDILESSQAACHPETETLLKSSLKTHALFMEKNSLFEFTEDEKYQLMQLPQNDHNLSKEDETICCLGLVDILLAYCYDIRTTEGEHTSCSAWNVSKLSSTLSWLEVHKSLKDVLKGFASRSLCYPLYRNWDLLNKVIDDTIILFSLGKSYILRCFLDLRRILQKDENRYLLNELYINDYCVWIQRLTPKKIMSLVTNLQNTKICKDDVPFNLRKIEMNWRDQMDYDSPRNSSSDHDLSSDNSSSFSELDSDDTDLEDDDSSDLESTNSETLDTEKSYSKKQLEKNEIFLADVNKKQLNNICINEVNNDFEDSKNQHKIRQRNATYDDIQCISTGITELLKVQSEI